jgi:hypothetical protein
MNKLTIKQGEDAILIFDDLHDFPLIQIFYSPSYPYDEAQTNAELIVEAVNQCIELNKDNPLAVAKQIVNMYTSLISIQLSAADKGDLDKTQILHNIYRTAKTAKDNVGVK